MFRLNWPMLVGMGLILFTFACVGQGQNTGEESSSNNLNLIDPSSVTMGDQASVGRNESPPSDAAAPLGGGMGPKSPVTEPSGPPEDEGIPEPEPTEPAVISDLGLHDPVYYAGITPSEEVIPSLKVYCDDKKDQCLESASEEAYPIDFNRECYNQHELCLDNESCENKRLACYHVGTQDDTCEANYQACRQACTDQRVHCYNIGRSDDSCEAEYDQCRDN